MVKTLYLIRHGETEGAETKRYKGSIDVPLSEKGKDQIKDAASFVSGHIMKSGPAKYLDYLRDIHRDRETGGANETDPQDNPELPGLSSVYCSDLSRALVSADIIAAPHGITPVVNTSLRERNFGVWEGMSFDEIRAQYPEAFEAWAKNPLAFSPINGESTLEVRDRVIPAVEKIMAEDKGEFIAVVAHGGVNRVILCHILGIPLENIFRIEQNNACVNVIEFWDKYPVVKLINGGFRG